MPDKLTILVNDIVKDELFVDRIDYDTSTDGSITLLATPTAVVRIEAPVGQLLCFDGTPNHWWISTTPHHRECATCKAKVTTYHAHGEPLQDARGRPEEATS